MVFHLLGARHAAPGGFNRLLVAIDKFTKWIEVKLVICPKAGRCGLSAWSSRTVREVQTKQKTHDPESQLPQIIIGFPKR
jgi:hypothetical protein